MPVETSGPPALADCAAELKEQRARAKRVAAAGLENLHLHARLDKVLRAADNLRWHQHP